MNKKYLVWALSTFLIAIPIIGFAADDDGPVTDKSVKKIEAGALLKHVAEHDPTDGMSVTEMSYHPAPDQVHTQNADDINSAPTLPTPKSKAFDIRSTPLPS